MSFFDDDFDNSGFQRVPKLEIGTYPRVRLRSLRSGETRKKQKLVTADVEILEANGEGAAPVGSVRNIFLVRHLDPDNWRYFNRDVKALLAAIVGESPEAMTKELAEETMDPANANDIVGEEFSVDVVDSGKTDKEGKPYTNSYFSAIAGTEQDQAAA